MADTAPRLMRHTDPCVFCGQPEQVEVFEVWGHDWMFETCCEGLHEQLVLEMTDDPNWAKQLLRTLELEALCGRKLRRVADDGGCSLILDWALQVHQISRPCARRFIAQHHAHCQVPVAWRFHAGISNGATLIGVAVVGNPVAPALNGRGILEVNRLCVRRDTAAALRWNAASMLYGWCAREAARLGWRKIITYTRADEPGTSLRAAGWEQECRVRGRGWHSARRARSNTNAWIGKTRWARNLAPSAQAAPEPPLASGRSGGNGCDLYGTADAAWWTA